MIFSNAESRLGRSVSCVGEAGVGELCEDSNEEARGDPLWSDIVAFVVVARGDCRNERIRPDRVCINHL